MLTANRELCQPTDLGRNRGQYHHNHRELPVPVSSRQVMVEEAYPRTLRGPFRLLLGFKIERKDCSVG